MRAEAARTLAALTQEFYDTHAASFSATRQAPWQGWQRVADIARKELLAEQDAGTPHPDAPTPARQALRVCDLACGNLRFERYLADALPGTELTFHAIDSCIDLAGKTPDMGNVSFLELDILGALADAADADSLPAELAGIPPCDLTVCFGFMHHVPGAELRARLLKALLDLTRPGGLVAVSFWQFMHDERLARRAHEAEAAASEAVAAGKLALDLTDLEPNDHLLGWQGTHGAFRFCHHFDEAEIDALLGPLPEGAVQELARFSADGKAGDLNRYVILRRPLSAA